MANHIHDSGESNFEATSKRRKGFPSESQVKRGVRVIYRKQGAVQEAGSQRPLPVRLRMQLIRIAASAPDDTTVSDGIACFRE